MEPLLFTELGEEDLPFVKEIFDYYTLMSTAVYFTEPVSKEEIRTFLPVHQAKYGSFVIRNRQGEAIGFCYFTRFKEKPAFRISVEVTVYLKPDCRHQGAGAQVLKFLETHIQVKGYKNMVALIDSENRESIRLFEKAGYVCCANIRNVAEKFGKKLTLNIYQKLI